MTKLVRIGSSAIGLSLGALGLSACVVESAPQCSTTTHEESTQTGTGGQGGVGGSWTTTTTTSTSTGGAGGGLPVGGLCDDYLTCVTPCAAEDNSCAARCYYTSSFECQVCNDRYNQCLFDNGCVLASGDVEVNCLTKHCYAAYDLCFVGEVKPTCEDADHDGFGMFCAAGPDCDDAHDDIHPGQAEICDGADDDCDGRIDEKALECSVKRKWAVLLYMAGDNDLGDSALLEIQNLAMAGGTNGDVAVALQVELGGQPSYYDQILPPEIYERTYRMVVPSSGHPDLVQMFGQAFSLGDVDVSRPEALTDFLDWAKLKVPAEHTMVIIWDHGGGWSGALVDDGSSTFMSMPDMRSAFEASTLRPDVIAFSACMMGAAEVLAELDGRADLVVASEEVSAGLSTPPLIAALHQEPSQTPEEASLALHQATVKMMQGYQMSYTVGTYRLAGVEPLVTSIRALGGRLEADMSTFRGPLGQKLPEVQAMAIASARDVVDLATELKGTGDAELDLLCDGVIDAAQSSSLIVRADAVTSAKPARWTPSLADAHGLSIFLPRPADTYAAELDEYSLLKLAGGQGGWGGVVAAWLGDAPVGETVGNFRLELEWTVDEGNSAEVDLDLYVYEPRVGFGAAGLPPAVHGSFSADSVASGLASEWFQADQQVNAGSYLVFVRYQGNGLPGPAAHATVKFKDARFTMNDSQLKGSLSTERPCFTAEGWTGGDILNGACSDLWFAGKLVRDDDLHTLRSGVYSDFNLRGRKLRLLPRP